MSPALLSILGVFAGIGLVISVLLSLILVCAIVRWAITRITRTFRLQAEFFRFLIKRRRQRARARSRGVP